MEKKPCQRVITNRSTDIVKVLKIDVYWCRFSFHKRLRETSHSTEEEVFIGSFKRSED